MGEVLTEKLAYVGWRQRELAERSNISQAIIRELQYNSVTRRRSARTLEALSVALGLHPDHLQDVALGITPTPPGQPRMELSSRDLIAKVLEDQARILRLIEGLYARVDYLVRQHKK